jgi:hypothetical protein
MDGTAHQHCTPGEPRLLDRLASVIRARHMSRSTEKTYRGGRGVKSPADLL